MTTDADLCALWSAWLRDRTLHRGCNLISAIMRATVDCAAGKGAPDAEEASARVVEPDAPRGASTGRILDPTGTDPYPPQIRPPAITHADDSPLRRSQDDFGRRHAARLVPRRHRVEAWEDGPPTNPAHDCGDMA